jgi:hypothetical protein
MADRNGRMAIKYTISTISIRANITRMSAKLGESSETNKAGTKVTIAQTVSLIQCGTEFLRDFGIKLPTEASNRLDFCQSHSSPVGNKKSEARV